MMMSWVVMVEGLSFHIVFYGVGIEPPNIDAVEDALRRRGCSLWSDQLQRLRGYHIRVETYEWTGGRTPGQKGAYVDHTEEDSRYTSAKLWQLWRSDRGKDKYEESYQRKQKLLRGQSSDSVASRDTGGSEQSTGGDSAGT